MLDYFVGLLMVVLNCFFYA